ncbi:threonine ammonia-lyase, biosynthetic [Ostreibacterium oceani]|uniref:L-threonine dehydratase n=1 Tax=Ostreibacterium oceani TaxID=2654998 RepID=A0A6N7EZN6_9GAMM|nr:threonine ammonia-lyase, biosynthetic [Ostreibacterium oceani]
MKDLLNNILTAPVYDVAKKTPLELLPQLSAKLNHQVYAKREDLQPVFSFKCRGAYNKLAKLVDAVPDLAGVITASAGNHAQGLALAASKLGIRATIVMPNITPAIKINAVKRFGQSWVTVVIHGDNFDEAAEHAKQLQHEQSLVFVHPFDDMDVIAGQGTVGKEIVEQLRHIDAVFIPIGGGGLAAGVGAYIKTVKPSIKIIGVEHVESASMQAAISQQALVTLPHVGVFADGIAVKRVGENNFAIARQVIDEMVTVTTDQICAAINDIFDETRTIVEPSGAASVAGLKKWCQAQPVRGQASNPLNLVTIVSGANMNFDRLRHVTERTAIGAQTECLLGVTIPERPGAFRQLCEIINGRAITEFNYRYAATDSASIFIGIAIGQGSAEIAEIIAMLGEAGYEVSDFSDNDIAKLHMRYMIGGKCADKSELLYRFEFPERPGALLNFLQHIGGHNITLFHYRNHGSDYGRVLIGIESPDEVSRLNAMLDKIGYYYVDETDNPAYTMFL